jgi:hypothetical protein
MALTSLMPWKSPSAAAARRWPFSATD